MRPFVPALALTVAAAGSASAQGVTLFGEARLGIGYNVDNEGEPEEKPVDRVVVDPGTPAAREVVTRLGPADAVRAVSRVRFGAILTGETDGGIAFGAEILADEAEGGADPEGQVEGVVFVTGDWGALTFGDTEGADEQHVGEAVENLSLTGLGDFNETPYISNGGGFGDDAIQFANDPEARPTVRYDYSVGGFGVSLSTNRDLGDVGVGASYTAGFEDGDLTAGVGYYDFGGFTSEETDRNPGGIPIEAGEQWSLGLKGTFGDFGGGVVYTSASAGGTGELQVLALGGTAEFGAWGVAAYFSTVLEAANGDIDAFEGRDSYGASMSYDLGGGARLDGGVARTYGRGSFGAAGDPDFAPALDAATVADFGIGMEF